MPLLWKRCIGCVALSFLSASAYASCTAASCSDTVGQFYVSDAGLYLQMTHGLSGLTNCTPLSGVYLTVPKADTNYTSFYALVLAAAMSGQSISFRTTDGSSGCTASYIYITPS